MLNRLTRQDFARRVRNVLLHQPVSQFIQIEALQLFTAIYFFFETGLGDTNVRAIHRSRGQERESLGAQDLKLSFRG